MATMTSELEEQINNDEDIQDVVIHSITEEEDGTAAISLTLSDEVKNRFKESEGLSRFSQKRFQKWFVDHLNGYLLEEG